MQSHFWVYPAQGPQLLGRAIARPVAVLRQPPIERWLHTENAQHSVLHSGPPTANPPLARLPAELFDEIVSYWEILPTHFYSATYAGDYQEVTPSLEYATRTVTLRALSQTCRALKEITLPRLWSRLETCWVPKAKHGTRFQYIMHEFRRKAVGVMYSDEATRGYIRTFCPIFSKFERQETLAYLSPLLQSMTNLHTIQILHYKQSKGFSFSGAVQGLNLPNIRTLIIPTDCSELLKACPNATHVRCAGGDGYTIVTKLKHCKVETLDGPIDWTRDRIVQSLVKWAHSLRILEIRHPRNSWEEWDHENSKDAPEAWAAVIALLVGLPELSTLKLSFPHYFQPTDTVTLEAARKVMRERAVNWERKLVIRRIMSPNHKRPAREDIITYSAEECFA